MPEKRIYTFSLSRNPSISGYGGYDEWEIGPITSEQADILLKQMDALILNCKNKFKTEGGYTGCQ